MDAYLSEWQSGNRWRTVFVVMITILTLFAWINRFVQDDAFISFRYARNLVDGFGLVWNPGERVEGYTNFLWTLIIAGGLKMGLPAPETAVTVGLLLFPVSLILIYFISKKVVDDKWQSLLVVVLTGTNYTFSCYATGGLETQLQACLVLVASFIVIGANVWTRKRALLLSLVFALGLMTRLDYAVFACVLGLTALFVEVRSGKIRLSLLTIDLAVCLILPVVVIVGFWLTWKFWYYGDILPNTYYVKAFHLMSVKTGVKYIYHFLASYCLFPFFLLMAVPAAWVLLRVRSSMLPFTGMVALWVIYIVNVGGCFMEFRLLVPVIPFIMLFLVWMFYDSGLISGPFRFVCVTTVLVGSVMHMATYRCTSVGVESISDLKSDVSPWVRIGQEFGAVLHKSGLVISTTAAGAIPYYSGLITIDEHGLNDKWVAKYGKVVGNKPGHQRESSIEYLMKRKVNLVVDPFMIVSLDQDPANWKVFAERIVMEYCGESQYKPMNVTFVRIPLAGSKDAVAVWYLNKNPEFDAVVRAHEWAQLDFVMNWL